MDDAAKSCDPTGLIRESYRIDGIGPEDCRTIFLDWALGLKDGLDAGAAARALLVVHSSEPADHPMTVLLREAAVRPEPTGRRRGGARKRR